MKRISKSTVGLISGVVGAVAAAIVLPLTPLGAAPQSSAHSPKIVVAGHSDQSRQQRHNELCQRHQEVAPSVVNIYSSRKISARQMQFDKQLDDPFLRDSLASRRKTSNRAGPCRIARKVSARA